MDYKERLKDKIHGMLAGVTIGDALGLPIETMSRAAIAQLNNGQGVYEYMDPVGIRGGDTHGLTRGSTSDDWQFTRAVACSLTKKKGFDIHDQALAHTIEYGRSTFGWGKGSVRSIMELTSGARSVGEDPLWFEEGKGCGNGVVMKVAPLAAVGALTGIDMITSVLELGRLTHPDMRARIAAVTIERYLELALFCSSYNRQAFIEHLQLIRYLESVHVRNKDHQHYLSDRLRNVDMSGGLDSLIATAGTGFTAWETVGFTLGVYFRHPNNFTKAILEAVNAGGDTDTNASVVGALVGAHVGYAGIPQEWKTIPVMEEVKEVSDRLWSVFA